MCPDDSNGIYNVPAGTLVNTGDTVLPSQHNPWATDSASAISNRFSKDGRAPATGDWNLNNFRITGLGAPIASGDATTKTYVDGLTFYTPKALTPAQQAAARANISASLRGQIFGLILSNNATDAVNDIDIAPGEAASTESNPVLMVLGSTLTKRLDAAWSVGTGNGGLDTGAIADGGYYVFLIQRSDTGVTDALFSSSSTSPTMPPNYDRKRYIGAFIRAGGTIRQFYQDGDLFLYKTSLLSVNVTNPGNSAVLVNLSTPVDTTREVLFTATLQNSSASNFRTGVLFSSPNQNDEAPSEITNPISSLSGVVNAAGGAFNPSGNFRIPTDNQGRIRYRVLLSDASVKIIISAHGWIDRRGRI